MERLKHSKQSCNRQGGDANNAIQGQQAILISAKIKNQPENPRLILVVGLWRDWASARDMNL